MFHGPVSVKVPNAVSGEKVSAETVSSEMLVRGSLATPRAYG
jgi:hypothetical protein